MSESCLYVNVKGQPVTHGSYSARSTFNKCPRQFQLERLDGWNDKVKRAAPLFGKCVEAGVQAYEESGRVANIGVRRFEELWAQVRQSVDFADLVYTATEGSWEQLNRAGNEMMRLYEIRCVYLPISTEPKTLFQQVLRKPIFPGTNLAILENKAVLDMLTFPKWNHKMLAPAGVVPNCDKCAARWSCALEADGPEFIPCEQHFHRPLIIDMKTSGCDLDEYLVALDPQLAEYAWQARIPDIAFLWFVKHGHGLKKGSRVTLLEEIHSFGAGMELYVLACDKPDEEEPGAEAMWFVGNYAALAGYDAELKGLRGKIRTTREAQYLVSCVADNSVVHCSGAQLTKQRIQFATARLTQQDMDDAGRSVAQTTVEMVRAHEEGYYEKQAGIRFPNEKCQFCAMRWICLNRPEDRDKYLTKRGEEWLDGLYEKDEV